ncbi:hypothetical protein [Lacipirellula parvula]|uniref:Uncharacterized protein n=1 Tax=Lacipirellula parvula TaxID=2650471 RepID=A0A5K7XEI1_9BACT|nr:hypothetical protein [Lacipirellula parvula]BBO34467.1 hypothetical protein PLANPX_4079 [Lacipirellula parvula]
MFDHPFRIARDGDLFSGVSDTMILFTGVVESEAREKLSQHLTPEQLETLFSNYDETDFRRQYYLLKKGNQ